MTIRLDTDNSGLLTVAPSTTPIVINRREATKGTGFAIDFGVGAVIDHWEVGFGANGIANRIDWNGLTQTSTPSAASLSGNSNFTETPRQGSVADTRVVLPVDYRANVSYVADLWSAAVEDGQGFGGASFPVGGPGVPAEPKGVGRRSPL